MPDAAVSMEGQQCVSAGGVFIFATPWTIAHQAPLSVGFSRRGYWSWLPFPSPGDLADPGIEPSLVHWQADSLLLSHQGSPNPYSHGGYISQVAFQDHIGNIPPN